jgi:hypothetical protein
MLVMLKISMTDFIWCSRTPEPWYAVTLLVSMLLLAAAVCESGTAAAACRAALASSPVSYSSDNVAAVRGAVTHSVLAERCAAARPPQTVMQHCAHAAELFLMGPFLRTLHSPHCSTELHY